MYFEHTASVDCSRGLIKYQIRVSYLLMRRNKGDYPLQHYIPIVVPTMEDNLHTNAAADITRHRHV